LIKQLLVIEVGNPNSESCACGQLLYSRQGFAEVLLDVAFDQGLHRVVEVDVVYSREIDAAAIFVVALDVPKKIHLLECRTQLTSRAPKMFIHLDIAFTKDLETH